jgi:hypothetical protein
MPYKTDKKIFDEFDNKFEYTDFLPSSIKTGNIKQFISDLRKADRDSLIEKIKTFKCSVPLNIRKGHPLSEENVENAIIYAGRYNYNKALSDIFDYLKSL